MLLLGAITCISCLVLCYSSYGSEDLINLTYYLMFWHTVLVRTQGLSSLLSLLTLGPLVAVLNERDLRQRIPNLSVSKLISGLLMRHEEKNWKECPVILQFDFRSAVRRSACGLFPCPTLTLEPSRLACTRFLFARAAAATVRIVPNDTTYLYGSH